MRKSRGSRSGASFSKIQRVKTEVEKNSRLIKAQIDQKKMEEKSAYVPPKYIPINSSDAGTIMGSVDEGLQASTGVLNQWSSGVCACFDDPQSCCLGTLCPCVLYGKNAEFLGSGTASGSCTTHCLLWGLLAGVSCILTGGVLLVLMPGCTIACCASQHRRALREKYNLPEQPCNDYCTHLCCHMCALCQENREIRRRPAHSGSLIPAVSPPEVQTMQ
ncbi:Plant cadmium resistance protein [Rhynchospora pubera]|uniref:Plant cadmium resistance protein n=1 Tax=Rhynchospora pubera TaxID=906938 RepID=A0AAV8EWA6_9POAL|nr:Plant cadmium resistance protein [Rhynchospora pubera]